VVYHMNSWYALSSGLGFCSILKLRPFQGVEFKYKPGTI
jgi:hypothetical protein